MTQVSEAGDQEEFGARLAAEQRWHAERGLAAAVRSEKRETFGTGRLRTRYKRCHEIAARAIIAAPSGTVMVQGTDHVDGHDLDGLGLTREHSWLELPDGRTWDPVTCEFDVLRIVSVAARYEPLDVARKISGTGFYGWWS